VLLALGAVVLLGAATTVVAAVWIVSIHPERS
jgi:hypothetical protein